MGSAGSSVELQMIVKNGGTTLRRCLQSAAAVVDRIVVGDTGSTDDSARVARSFGAKVVKVLWAEDFAQARNAVLRHVKCDWVLVLDADEMLGPDAGASLHEAIARAEIFAYEVERWNYVAQSNSRSGEQGARLNPRLIQAAAAYPAYVPSWNTRLFRRHRGLIFERPVHESVMPRVEALGLKTTAARFVIHHFGHVEDAAEERMRKNELYQAIGTEHLRAHPTDARTCFELGLGEFEHFQRPEAALRCFERAVRLAPNDVAPWIFRGVCLVRLRRFDEALQALAKAGALDANNIVLHETAGDVYFHTKRFAEAAGHYERAASLGSGSALVVAKLGASLVHLGRRHDGMTLVNAALDAEPEFAELHDLGTAVAMLAGEAERAAQLAVRRLMLPKVAAFHYVLAGSLCVAMGERTGARAVLEKGQGLFPDDTEIQKSIAQLASEPPARGKGKLLTLPVGGAGRLDGPARVLPQPSALPLRRKGSPRPAVPSRA